MKKLKLHESMKQDIMQINNERRDEEQYLYLTDKILSGMFDWFLKHKLTVQTNAASWHTGTDGRRQIMSYGFSGIDINHREPEGELINMLAHEIFCKAEWLARCVKDGKSEIVKAYYGREFLNIAL